LPDHVVGQARAGAHIEPGALHDCVDAFRRGRWRDRRCDGRRGRDGRLQNHRLLPGIGDEQAVYVQAEHLWHGVGVQLKEHDGVDRLADDEAPWRERALHPHPAFQPLQALAHLLRRGAGRLDTRRQQVDRVVGGRAQAVGNRSKRGHVAAQEPVAGRGAHARRPVGHAGHRA